MCGIGGIIRREPKDDTHESASLLLGLAHRGPDGRGIFTSCDGRASMVHARLAILGAGQAGRQPMTRGNYTISFNGEIYNFRVLREELRRQGEEFSSETDTEVLLALFAREGPDCLLRLRGMFAFAIWDGRDGTCFLARDRFGIKPLYYGFTTGGDLIFASEVKAIMDTGLIEARLDAGGLQSFLTTGSVAEPLTMFEGVRSLEAGKWMRWRNGFSETSQYFRVDFQERETTSAEARDRAHTALLDAMRHHFVSDVPVGIFLSGGLDSGALLSLARESGQREIATFSIAVEDSANDESNAARERAAFFGTDHREMLLTQELAGRWVEPFLETLDQPTVDGFNTYCVSKLAADHGYRVVLSGLGGDELFGGYPSFARVPQLMRAADILRPWRRIVSPVAHAWEGHARSGRNARLAAFFQTPPTWARAYETERSIFSPLERRRIGEALMGDNWPAEPAFQHREREDHDAGNRVSYLELTRYMRNQLLRDADVMSMGHGLEIRVPFLDHELFGVLRTIPATIRLAPEKQLLRDAVPELPHRAGDQRKRGFTLPFASWLDSSWSDLQAELIGAPKVPLDSWSRKWSLIVLSRWLRRHNFESWRR